MSTRLVFAIFTTLLQEAVLAAVVLVGLPRLDIELPLGVLVALMVALAAFAIFTYRMGSQALRKKPITGLPSMVGTRGKAASRLAPDGFVRIKGELWEAKSEGEEIDTGEQVTVVDQDALKLTVRRSSPGDLKGTE